jgi:WD40 repeat protein
VSTEDEVVETPPPAAPPVRRQRRWGRWSGLALLLAALFAASAYIATRPRTASGSRERLESPVGALNCVTYSPDAAGTYVAAGAATGEALLWERESGRRIPVDLPTHEPLMAVAISTGGFLVAGGIEQYVLAWHIEKRAGKLLPAFPSPVTALQYRPRNYEFAVGMQSGQISLVNTRTGAVTPVEPVQPGGVKALAFSNDGTLLATGGGDGQIIVRTAASQRVIRVIPAHKNEISALAFSADGKAILSGGWDNKAVLTQVNDGAVMREWPHDEAVSAVGFAGKSAVTGSWDGMLRFWSLEDGKLLAEHDTGDAIHGLAVRLDGGQIATVGPAPAVQLWSAPTGESGK